ncbi:hypothetical protein GCM10009639_36960 [Kitasatospora putterlickiae]|uniref:Uncharacterized protein n=1 Tax=Kitasatospora putterlickiae TaxID=221725 RepID=A0ABP4IUW3_9ACTN
MAIVPYTGPAEARALRQDLAERLSAHGRSPGALRVLTAVTYALGGAPATAREGAADIAGTPGEVADALTAYARDGGSDGFLLTPHPAAGPLDEFVDQVVPLLRARGAHRTGYTGTTLRDHLGLARTRRPSRETAA